jgi:hypothetical protein
VALAPGEETADRMQVGMLVYAAQLP